MGTANNGIMKIKIPVAEAIEIPESIPHGLHTTAQAFKVLFHRILCGQLDSGIFYALTEFHHADISLFAQRNMGIGDRVVLRIGNEGTHALTRHNQTLAAKPLQSLTDDDAAD